jgi:perosamine synthetase
MSAHAVLRGAETLWRHGDDPRAALAAQLATTYAAPSVQLTQSGTAALQLALRAARVIAGDGPIALPAFGCYDLATAAVALDTPVVLYDLDPNTLAPDLDSLTALGAMGVRVVVVAPIAGVPVDWEAVTSATSAYGAVVIEDAAQCHGASWRGRPCGSFGAISVLSFGRGKGWSGARGGAVLIRDHAASRFLGDCPIPEARRADGISVAAASAVMWAFSSPWRYGIPASLPWLDLGATKYHPPRPVRRMTRASAAVLQASREDATREAMQRRVNAEQLLRAARDLKHIRIIEPPLLALPGYLRLPVRISGSARPLLATGWARRLGISPPYPTSLGWVDALRPRLRSGGHWPGAETLVRELALLPTHSRVTRRERVVIVDLLRSARWSLVSARQRAAGV